jgi:hypothetical protein
MSVISEEPGMEDIILRIQSLIPVVKDAETLLGLAIQLDVLIEEAEKDDIKVVRRKLMTYLLGDEINTVNGMEEKLYGIYEKLVHETTDYPAEDDAEAPTAREGFDFGEGFRDGADFRQSDFEKKSRRESFGYGLGNLGKEESEKRGRDSVGGGEKEFGSGYGFATRAQYTTQSPSPPADPMFTYRHSPPTYRQPEFQPFRHPAPQAFRQPAPHHASRAPFSPSAPYLARQSSPSSQYQFQQPQSQYQFQQPQTQYQYGLAKLKECKIAGVIGSTKVENRLDYDGLASQIQSKVEHYPESEIIEAVIRAIAPGLYLRNYLEARKLRKELTLLSLMKVLKTHFTEKDTSKIFHEMSNAIQKPEDTHHTFCIKMLALRDKILNMSADGNDEYPQKLVQSQMQHSIYTGFRKSTVRQEMRMLLKQKNLTDDELLETVAEVMLNETEHEEKVTTQTAQKSKKNVDTNAVQQNSDQPKPPKQTPLMQQITDQLTALGTKMQDIGVINAKINELTDLKSQFENFKTEINTYCNRSANNNGGTGGGMGRGSRRVSFPLNRGGGRGGGVSGGAGRGAGQTGVDIVGSRRHLCNNCRAIRAERCDHCFNCGDAGHNFTNCPNPPQQQGGNE